MSIFATNRCPKAGYSYTERQPIAPHVPIGCDTPLINKESIKSAMPLNFSSRMPPVERKTSAESARPRLVSDSIPACTVVSPVYELVPVRASVPAPDFVMPPPPDTGSLP